MSRSIVFGIRSSVVLFLLSDFFCSISERRIGLHLFDNAFFAHDLAVKSSSTLGTFNSFAHLGCSEPRASSRRVG